MAPDKPREPIFSLRKNLRRFFVPPPHQNGVLDGFRALSILYVILFHAFYLPQPAFADLQGFTDFVHSVPAWFNWVWHGDSGVDMFFILSGFLIATILLREQDQAGSVDVKRFYGHRLLRILPVYVFAVMLYSVPENSNRDYFWANLLFINNFLPLDKILIPWSWSLSIEMQFYLLFPLLFFALLRSARPLSWLVMLFLGATAIRYLVIALYPELYEKSFYYHSIATPGHRPHLMFEQVYMNLYTRMGPLILGVLMAWSYYHHREVIRDWLQAHAAIAAGVALLAVLMVAGVTAVDVFNPSIERGEAFNLHYMAWYRNLFSLGMAVLLFLALFGVGPGRLLHSVLALRFWYPLAQAAYSTYLFHIPFLAVGYWLMLDGQVDGLKALALGDVFGAILIAILCSLIFSLLIYLFIERPFMNIYKRKRSA
ncbi:MAG: acyltransferase [Gammaproteobacteria bacterium]|nr:acyltransferase [Gammaproteobacteria bacterium]